MVTVIGWGNINATGFERPTALQETEMPLITTDTCQRAHGLILQYGQNVSLAVTDNMLCAGLSAGGTGACVGDSGE